MCARISYSLIWCWVISPDMAPLFESLTAAGLLESDAALLAEMRGRIDEETRKLDEK